MLFHRIARHTLEASAFATLICAWGLVYTIICPPEPRHGTAHGIALAGQATTP